MRADWHYFKNGKEHGPVTFEDLQRLAVTGELKETDEVWRQCSASDWTAARNIPDLFAKPVPVSSPLPESVLDPVPSASGANSDNTYDRHPGPGLHHEARGEGKPHLPDLESGQTCRHCKGTTFCGGSKDSAGSINFEPSCVTCNVKSGLDPKEEYRRVVCSVCGGKGFIYLSMPSSRQPGIQNESPNPAQTKTLWQRLNQPIEQSPLWKSPTGFVVRVMAGLIAICLLAYGGLRGYKEYNYDNRTREPSKEQHRRLTRDYLEGDIRTKLEQRSGLFVKQVRLVQESENKYTGFAETTNGTTIRVSVTVDGERYVFETK